ncbi:MBL fold metallo-hydrolase [Halobacteria archaeon AArc-m2/3/4]|uniref:MBL fold metallo-hydrolase n=1 Tax=Natronoglomus mannanivorans TaxID=2979990 RepID=A0ABT2QAK8_9EURY|nr:MBL fold metallo-hydrolase [Halobacteria archaeon AArc-m2/3/4]
MHRISLGNTVFEGANSTYCFDGESTVLIDTGVAIDETRAELESELAALGVEFADVDAIVLTHYHADHSGLAGEIQAESDATVYAHPADAPLIAGDAGAWEDLEATQRRLFEEWGMPEPAREELLGFLRMSESEGIYGEPVDVTPVEDGETLSFGVGTDERELELEVCHTPGHTAGHICLVHDEEIFTGDALLPEYTPNVGGADVRVDRPLEQYLRTLEIIADGGFDRAWPGHREPIDDPAQRARRIRDHHEERAFRVLSALESSEPADAWTVSDRLFGDLSTIHILHGPGEASAHLEHLTRTGALERGDAGYRLADGVEERIREREDGRWPL